MCKYLYQLIISIDQLFNAVAGGWADETFSARCYRCRYKNSFWKACEKIVNTLFFWDKGTKKEPHCEAAFLNEVNGVQRPEEYRKG